MAIILPKKREDGKYHFSYSQYSKWKENKKDYIRNYFLGDKFEGNAYTEFGHLIGEALENNDFSGFTDEEKKVMSKITRLDQFEREINFDLGEFVLLGFIDTNDVKGVAGPEGDSEIVENIVDYKTGDLNKVAKYQDDDYEQVTIYAGAIEQETGVLPKKGWVELIERVGNAFKGEKLKLGKKVVVIPQDVSKEAVESVKEKIIKVAKDVSAHYKVFQKLNSIEI